MPVMWRCSSDAPGAAQMGFRKGLVGVRRAKPCACKVAPPARLVRRRGALLGPPGGRERAGVGKQGGTCMRAPARIPALCLQRAGPAPAQCVRAVGCSPVGALSPIITSG